MLLAARRRQPRASRGRVSDISVREASDVLQVSEKTVYRWIRQGVVPAYRYQGQYRLDRGELEAWAQHKRIGRQSSRAAPGAEEQIQLLQAVQVGGIHYKLEGDAPAEIFRQVVEYFPFSPSLSPDLRETLHKTLCEREELVTTGIGHGIALPHPRHPSDWGLGEPAVGVFFLERPVDFLAMDGVPVQVLFVVLCATVKGHLKMLSQVSHLINRAEFRELLAQQPPRSELLQAIQTALPKQTAG